MKHWQALCLARPKVRHFGAGWRQPNLVRHEWCRSERGGVKRVEFACWVSGGRLAWRERWLAFGERGERGGDGGDRAARRGSGGTVGSSASDEVSGQRGQWAVCFAVSRISPSRSSSSSAQPGRDRQISSKPRQPTLSPRVRLISSAAIRAQSTWIITPAGLWPGRGRQPSFAQIIGSSTSCRVGTAHHSTTGRRRRRSRRA